MRYILDFDDTIFDTKAFIEKSAELGVNVRERTPAVFESLARALKDTGDSERLGEFMQSFVHPDAWEFLKEYGNQSVIASSAYSARGDNTDPDAHAEFQFEKIRFALGGVLPGIELKKNVFVTAEESKKSLFTEIWELFGRNEQLICLDDSSMHIDSAEACGIEGIRMQREEKYMRTPEGSAEVSPRSVSNFEMFRERIRKKELAKDDES